ncbi:MAG: hypothetical protein HY678_10910, partial [Chloroflexi bacterium]|nr:hypothetical protein [Chloroflexota bacterium]
MAGRSRKFVINDAVLPEDLAGGSSVIEYAAPVAAEDFNPDSPEGPILRTRAENLASSELDQWEGARSAAEHAAMRAAEEWQKVTPDSEMTDDPVRVYLREIGRVNLLKAEDERVLARAMELEKHLDLIETALSEAQGRTPHASAVVKQILVRLAGMQAAASAIARFVGLRGDIPLSVLMTDPELRALIDGPDNEQLIKYL